MQIVSIEARDLSDAWFQFVFEILDKGSRHVIDRGSYAGQTRLEFDYAIGHITHPGTRPLIPDIPPACGIPNPVEEAYIYGGEGYERSYIEYVMSDRKEPGESYCYSEDTEILTNKGWKFFKDLDRTDQVATLDPESNEIVYQKPEDYIDFEYTGKMFEMDSKYINFCVNKGHSLFVQKKNYHKDNRDALSLKKIENVLNSRFLKFKSTGVWKGITKEHFVIDGVKYDNPRYKEVNNKVLKMNMNNWLRVFGIWLAEGSLMWYKDKNSYCVVISLNNVDQRNVVKLWIENLGLHVTEYKRWLLINDKRLYRYLIQFGHAHDKFIPSEFKKLPPEQLRYLYEGMMLGDGDKTGHRYTTASKRLADDFSELCFKLGKVAKVRYDASQSSTGYINNGVYRIGIASKRYLEPTIENTIKMVDYVGKLYCVKVPKYHILYVRRNGIPHWSGNTYGERLTKYPISAFIENSMVGSPKFAEIIWAEDEIWHNPNIIIRKDNKRYVNQIELVIYTYKNKGYRNNQLIMQVGLPDDLLLLDPACLRHIDTRIQDGKLHFFVYFRSWCLWNGFPANLSAIQTLKEYMAAEIGVEDGEMVVSSKGLHLYGYAESLAKLRCMRD